MAEKNDRRGGHAVDHTRLPGMITLPCGVVIFGSHWDSEDRQAVDEARAASAAHDLATLPKPYFPRAPRPVERKSKMCNLI
jgi:hypothetical protein